VKKIFLHLSAAAVCLVSAVSAYAKPVGSMTCSNLSSFNVSAYSLGIENSVDARTGTVGKPAYQPLSVHASIAQFQQFLSASTRGTPLGVCKLLVSGTDGATVEFEFVKIFVEALAVGASGGASKDEEKSAYTDIEFQYGAVNVKTNAGGDDGGTSKVPPIKLPRFDPVIGLQ
jgi:hypothetical protein